MIGENRDYDLLAVFSLQIASQPLPIHNVLFIQKIADNVGSRLGAQSARGGRVSLSVPQCSVPAQDWKGVMEVAKVFLLSHECKKFDDEIRREIGASSSSV